MTDNFDSAKRSSVMAAIHSKDTKPELIVRRAVYALGFRYRLHAKDVPGKPDLVFRKMRKAIFVHGCFWHRHPGCSRASMPKTRAEFWQEKFEKNVNRDKQVKRELRKNRWRTLTIWQCELRDPDGVVKRLSEFLGS
ncbi:very short patch repair endonuclease [Acidobacterium sp. S8]|uniref:very short patch repair endonuclease n=1 Tax=Acidobacterium sp. S8 TaxID=1641854 RepID=UPI00131AF81B|nr:very short patch repair endonuclease [Acidobacterium sp. S8]